MRTLKASIMRLIQAARPLLREGWNILCDLSILLRPPCLEQIPADWSEHFDERALEHRMFCHLNVCPLQSCDVPAMLP